MSSVEKVMVFVGQTFRGHAHDSTRLKAEFSPDLPWCEAWHVLLDLGYQGIRTDYTGADREIPHKKPRKSKAHSAPQWTEDQQQEHHVRSSIRLCVENALAGLKRYHILVHDFRNKKDQFEDAVSALSAGLWHLTLSATVI